MLELNQLLNCLKQSRCLVILDRLETLLDADRVGQFRSGFEAYGELLYQVRSILIALLSNTFAIFLERLHRQGFRAYLTKRLKPLRMKGLNHFV